jgi:NAD(P)-dependent dehydrogenase (short-subunit alcohol dehydrogenase family)
VGQVAVTQAFLPLLRKGKGRIINIGSIAGRMSMMLGGPYSASKFALEAITDSLRLELQPWGIEVVIVEPGAIATPIWDKSMSAARSMLGELPPQTMELYGPAIRMVTKAAQSAAQNAAPTDHVVRAVEHALTATRPRTRYIVGKDARIQRLIASLPDRLRDWIVLKYLARGQ